MPRILVPVDGTQSDREALELTCLLAKKKKARVELVYIIQVRRSLPLDADLESDLAKGEDVLEAARRVAEQLEVQVETSLLQARDLGAAIVDEAVQTNADAIVLGLPYKTRFGEYEIGSTATYVMKNAPCRVWLAREPIGATT